MPKLDKVKENLAMLKLWLSLIIGVFTALAGWSMNKFIVDENILLVLAMSAMFALLLVVLIIVRRINKTIDEIGNLKK